jgi:hypothetical protein
MRAALIILMVLGVFAPTEVVQAQAGKAVISADGPSKGARCIDDTHLKTKNGKVATCSYDCYPVDGGAVCRNSPCEYVICNDPPGSYCSNPTGPEPGLLRTTTTGGICDPTGDKAGVPGECYYPEVIINCGSAEACVFVGHGRDFCIYVPPREDRR